MNQKIINDLLCMERRLKVRKMMAAQLYMRECTEQENNPHENAENSLRRGSQRPSYIKNFKRRKKLRKHNVTVKSAGGKENKHVSYRPNKIFNLIDSTKEVNLVGEGRLNNTNLEKERRNRNLRKRKTNVKSAGDKESAYVACRPNKIFNLMDPTKKVNLVGEGRLNNTNLEKERRNRNLRKRNVNVVVKSAHGKENTHVSHRPSIIVNFDGPTKKVELLDDKSYNSKNTNVDAHSKRRVLTRKRQL